VNFVLIRRLGQRNSKVKLWMIFKFIYLGFKNLMIK